MQSPTEMLPLWTYNVKVKRDEISLLHEHTCSVGSRLVYFQSILWFICVNMYHTVPFGQNV